MLTRHKPHDNINNVQQINRRDTNFKSSASNTYHWCNRLLHLTRSH